MWPLLIALVLLVGAGGALAFQWLRTATRRKALGRIAAIDALLASGDSVDAADAAIAALAAETDPAARAALRLRLARVLLVKEEFAEAARLCDESAADAPGDVERADALVEAARCLAAAGSFREASDRLAQSSGLQRAPEAAVEASLVAADIALSSGRFAEAERELSVAFDRSGRGPFAAEVGLGHARLQFLRGNFRQCVAEVSRYLEQLPGDDLQALALVTLARALMEQEHGDAVGADHALTRALVIAHAGSVRALATACHALAQAHFGNTKDALEAAAAAPGLTLSPRFAAEAHCLVGDTMRVMHRVPEARASYQNALALDPDRPEALWGLACCAEAFGLYDVAENYYRLCAESAPEHYVAARSEVALGR